MKNIRKNIRNMQSDYFYEKLYTRFTNDDTVFTKEEARHLYYGYIFQSAYQPYRVDPMEDSMVAFLQTKRFDDAISAGNNILKQDPFNMEIIYYLYNCYENAGNKDKAMIFGKKYFILLNAILSSGDGKNKKTAWLVTSVRDEYEILTFFDLMPVTQAFRKKFDIIQLSIPNTKNLKEAYFNVGLPLKYLKRNRKLIDNVKK